MIDKMSKFLPEGLEKFVSLPYKKMFIIIIIIIMYKVF